MSAADDAASSAGQAAIAFGPFHYDPLQRVIRDASGPLPIGCRAVHILGVLLEQPGRLYSREEIIARVWPHTVVEETSLRVHVSALRKALGDGMDGARYITNVPGRGYAFVGATQLAQRHGRCAPAEGLPAPEASDRVPPLPPQLTRLIGREQALDELADLLARERLVSIVGAGGMGKTAVALAVANRLSRDHAGGVHLVELSPLSEPAQVAAELARTQGLVLSAGDCLAALEAALRDKRLLFVLDNCEHVIDAAAALVHRLMRSCPGVHFLATSREPLEVEAEWVVRLPPLAMPARGQHLALRELLAYPAVQLFTESARAHGDAFEPMETDVPALQQLCACLDGIPLAIELAAARVDSLGVQGLSQRLENAFELLTRGRRTALSRHRTLQAVMDWSYDLLSDSEQRVLQRLSSFRGAFDLEGAAAIATCARLDRTQVIDAVLSLTAKSLIVLESADDGVLLHRLLYVTRLYAEKRWAGTDDDASAVRRRHARFVADGLQHARHAGTSMARYHWSPALGSPIADLRAAIEWALMDENDLGLGIQLTASAKRTYCDAGLVEEYLHYIDTALAKLPRAGDDRSVLELPLRVAAGFMMGYVHGGSLRYPAVFSRTRELLQTLGSDDDRIEALFGMSTSSYGQGDYHQSLACCQEIRGLATGRFEPLSIAISDRVSALCLHALGDHDAAELLAWRVLAFNGLRVGRQFLSEVPFDVSMRVQLARIQWLRGEFATAWDTLAQALAASESAHVFARCQVLGTAAVPMAIWRGDASLADRWTRDLRDLAARQGLAYWQVQAQVFQHVRAGHAIEAGGAEALAIAHCAPLGDVVATMHAARPAAATQARVAQGAVGWCAPEVLRLAALHDSSDPPEATTARLQQAMQMAQAQGARFWMLRIALSMAGLAGDPAIGTQAVTTTRQLLASIDDGSAVPDLVAARKLLAGHSDNDRLASARCSVAGSPAR